jgi:hypothetical protein
MKILTFTLSLYFSLFAACAAYAANTTLISNYPAPNGSYNQIVITPQTGATGTSFPCASQGDVGQLYYDTATNILQLCANVGSPAVPTKITTSSETCFNRFCCVGTGCNTTCATTTNFTTGNPCPAGYTQAKSSGTRIVDNFSNAVNGSYTVYTTACCTSSSPVLPT